ncbi:polysaccharide pyruvyl transferase family protein [Streptococcus parasuis]|uniref:polysaccharide pyruvyl transferase family protein n=1 Tax=Streptococcus parasuis TaxID=1501662 RepID=UPI0028A94902|nr:polysaccharide pyruvyl transferase family protein [Streptococcus parasuis]
MKKVGIITFHNSYNCGSMLETYAMQTILEKHGLNSEIVNFSSDGQKELYSIYFKKNTLKNIVKNSLLFLQRNRLKNNNAQYEAFKQKNFKLSKTYNSGDFIDETPYSVVVAGSDQIWNVTIKDADDAYFLNWVEVARKVAYAPSFGAKKISDYAPDVQLYRNFLNDFDALSIRENNGQKWVKELINKDVDVLLDPTLLLEKEDYDLIAADDVKVDEDYIFFYSPSFDTEICDYVRKIADKHNLKVITWSTKSYTTKFVKKYGFELPSYESPAAYLTLIKNAKLIITTSYHGTIFSTIYRKNFITVKNGEMYGDDDRVITLLNQLGMMDRLIPFNFDPNFNYLSDVDYSQYDVKLNPQKIKSIEYIKENIVEYYKNGIN